MKYLGQFVFGSIVVLLLLLGACTGPFDWSGIEFPCNESRPCKDGFECVLKKCVPPGTTPDGGVPETPPGDGRFPKAIKDPRVAFLYVGPVGDFGWTYAHEESRLYLDKLGYRTTSAGPVSPQGAPKQIEEFIKNGYNIIVGTSFDFLVPMLARAHKHPEINFLECSGFQTGRNIGSYFGRLYQMEWVAGMIAGLMTKTNRVGIITTVPIGEMVRHVNAFTNGVKRVNPNAVVIVKWVKNWFDPKKEPVLAKELLKANADVIHPHTDTTIPLELIENKTGEPLTTANGDQVFTIGYNSSNACKFGPRTCLTSIYWNWGPMLKRIIDEMKKGSWDPSNIIWEYLRVDKKYSSFYMTRISPKVPGSVRVEVEGFLPKLAAVKDTKKSLSFQGPLKDNTGKTRLKKGAEFDDDKLLHMCWFVEGVVEDDGKTPAKVPVECKGDR